MITAEEFRIQQNILPDFSPLRISDGLPLNGNKRIEKLMIEFAKLHVQEALKQASEIDIIVEKRSQYGKYRKWQKVKKNEEFDLFDFEMQTSQNKKGILNAYNLENIK